MLPSIIIESKWTPYIAVVATIFCFIQFFFFLRSTFVPPKRKFGDVPKKCNKTDGYKENVIAYVFDGKAVSVSGSPFSTKLTAFLRLTDIPHTIKEADFEKAPKGKVPYIEHAGSFFGDSQLIIRYLENTYDIAKMSVGAVKLLSGVKKPFVPFNKLTSTDQALSDAIRLTCEGELYWAINSVRWCGEVGIGKKESLWDATNALYFTAIPAFIRPALTAMIRTGTMKDAWSQGLARHSPADQLYLATRAAKSLSVLLGDKQFFLGDFPAECDCIAFSTLDCLLDDSRWPNPLTVWVRQECPNLVQYVARFRSMVFADMVPGDVRPPSRETGTPIPAE